MISSWASYKCHPYCGYYTNSYYFYTKTHDDKCTVHNSGVTLLVKAMHIFSTKDKNQYMQIYHTLG